MYRQQDASAGAGQQSHFLSASTPSSSFSQTTFPSPLFALDPSLHNSPQLLHPPTRNGASPQPYLDRRVSSGSQGSMQPPSSNVSPQMNRAIPTNVAPGSSRVLDRELPSKNVTAETITDAYVAFILYCNPHFPMDVDSTTLRTNFESPPKSDNKDFKTYRLFELIQKFDAKEIKTWNQLALDLGVEAPDVGKGQSVQKVQQYSVRLKRWMRAMHIDAFFEYLLGKQHAYFTDIPSPGDPYPAGGRDGVLAEEDLAVRALDPSFRPKRGRRRNSEAEHDEDADAGPASKQPRLDGQSHFDGLPLSAYPASAHPDAYHDPWAMASAVTPHHFAPWASKPAVPQTAVTPSAPSHLRWQLHGSSQNVSTPHPMTAQPTSMAAHIEAAFDEPKSAITPARRRRKHGPAVSSAWPSANAPGAKPRGRPPASRSVQDGPFSTFPADPANEKGSMPPKAITPDPPPSVEVQSATQMPPPLNRRQSDGPGRPGRLSLQVPQHTGGPVRLATPPPQVLVNGEINDSDGRSTTQTPIAEQASHTPRPQASRQRIIGNMQVTEREVPGFAFEALKRVLASDLLRAELVGRSQRLSGEEAKGLADVVLGRLGVPREDTESSRDDVARLTAASWLGLGEQLNVPLGPARGQGKRIRVSRFRLDAEGYEEIVSAREEAAEDVNEIFDLSWVVTMHGCQGSFELKGLTLQEAPPPEEDSHDRMMRQCMAEAGLTDESANDAFKRGLQGAGTLQHGPGAGDDGVDWKAKYMALDFARRVVVGHVKRTKNRIIEQILDALL